MKPTNQMLPARWLTIAGLAIAISACGGNMRDLQADIDAIKARPGGPIEPLPEPTPAPKFTYQAGDRRSPFMPDDELQRANPNPDAVAGPDVDRPREFLEQEPLDALTMVGTLSDHTGSFGLVQDSVGRVHRVTIGNHMGQNFGRITSITESEIALVEVIPDGLGGYIERPTSIGLSD